MKKITEEVKKKAERIIKRLAKMTHAELKNLGINGQTRNKIKRGESVTLYSKTIERLERLGYAK